jgi:hypothetical protein
MSGDTKVAARDLTASEYVLALFEPTDNVAILVRNRSTHKTVQRMPTRRPYQVLSSKPGSPIRM